MGGVFITLSHDAFWPNQSPPDWISNYLTLRLVSSLNNNPQNNEMNFCENIEVYMLKIIIIMIGYTLKNNSLLI